MGLDQTLGVIGNEEEIERDLRKVNCLQGYFEREYKIKNGQEVIVLLESILEIKEITDYILENPADFDYIERKFPPTRGFFYGGTKIDRYYFANVKEVNDLMNEVLAVEGIYEIFYKCWY